MRTLSPSSGLRLAAALVLNVATTGAYAESSDPAGWKSHRDPAMGFEARYPDGWRVHIATGSGPETVSVDEAPQAGKPRRSVQFWVQRQANPQHLPIQQWYENQLRRVNAAPPAMTVTVTSLGGRAAVRREVVRGAERHLSFYAPLNDADVFQVTLKQPASGTGLDETYQKVLSSLRFTP